MKYETLFIYLRQIKHSKEIKQERAFHIKKTLGTLANNRIRLTKKDFDLQIA